MLTVQACDHVANNTNDKSVTMVLKVQACGRGANTRPMTMVLTPGVADRHADSRSARRWCNSKYMYAGAYNDTWSHQGSTSPQHLPLVSGGTIITMISAGVDEFYTIWVTVLLHNPAKLDANLSKRVSLHRTCMDDSEHGSELFFGSWRSEKTKWI